MIHCLFLFHICAATSDFSTSQFSIIQKCSFVLISKFIFVSSSLSSHNFCHLSDKYPIYFLVECDSLLPIANMYGQFKSALSKLSWHLKVVFTMLIQTDIISKIQQSKDYSVIHYVSTITFAQYKTIPSLHKW